jgi:hypothetical protein
MTTGRDADLLHVPNVLPYRQWLSWIYCRVGRAGCDFLLGCSPAQLVHHCYGPTYVVIGTDDTNGGAVSDGESRRTVNQEDMVCDRKDCPTSVETPSMPVFGSPRASSVFG